jgi:glc operon protein GlcG
MRNEPTPGHDEVVAAVDAIRAELVKRGRTAVIAVADAHGELIALLRLDGAPLSSIAIACNKAFTAARLRRTTREVGATLRERGTDIAFYGDHRYLGFGGGVPIRIGEVVVGGVAVSGLSDADDEELALMGAAIIAAAGSTPTIA